MNVKSMLCAALLLSSVGSVGASERGAADYPQWYGAAHNKISEDVIKVLSPESFARRFSRKALPLEEEYSYEITQWTDDGAKFTVYKRNGLLPLGKVQSKEAVKATKLHSVGFYHAAKDTLTWPLEDS